MRAILAFTLFFAASPAMAGLAQQPLNLGFERAGIGGPDQPWGWRPLHYAPGVSAVRDSSVARDGRWSFRFTGTAPEGSASMYWLPPMAARGREVELRGWLRTDGAEGRAVATIESWAPAGATIDTARLAGPASSDGWRQFGASVVVDSSAHSVVVTVGLSGTGSAWFDDLGVYLDGTRRVDLPVERGPDPDELAWLAAHVHPLWDVDDPSWSDLAAFGDIVGDARIVALGEATHGTSEFFTAKHRLLRYLVEEHGFRVFLIEANQLAVEQINAYVHGGPGTAAEVMRVMFGVWNTEEMRQLITWMREHNRQHPEPYRAVSFVGFDMQDPRLPMDSVYRALARLHPEISDTVRALHADYRSAWRETQYPQASEERRRAWLDAAHRAYELIDGARLSMLAAASSPADSMEVDWALQNGRVVRQAAESALTGRLATRDSAMAANILWTLNRRFPGARAVVWAHDAHISEGRDEVHNFYQGGSMGRVLAKTLGAAYRTVGLLTYAGAYRGYQRNAYLSVPLFPAPVGSIEHALHRIALAHGMRRTLIADLREAESAPRADWLLAPRPIRLLGFAAEDWGFAYPIAVGRQFDAILFVDTTTPAREVSTAPDG